MDYVKSTLALVFEIQTFKIFLYILNPCSPCGERLCLCPSAVSLQEFQSTPPMRGATTYVLQYVNRYFISIHAPHAGSDSASVLLQYPFRNFNPRPPCGERQISLLNPYYNALDFNPRPPCGERQQKLHICKQICILICAKLPKI